MPVRLLGALLFGLVVVSIGVPEAPVLAADDVGVGDLDRPVLGVVLAVFDAPTRYGPGHRGVDLAAPTGSPVRAAAAGRVTFAGRVVDATWVTVDHGSLRTTVGPLRTVAVVRGSVVARGAVLGTSGQAHGRPAVHWSARRGQTYVDPLGVELGAVPSVATLLPVWEPGRSAPAWPGRQVR